MGYFDGTLEKYRKMRYELKGKKNCNHYKWCKNRI